MESFRNSMMALFWCFVMLAFVIYIFALIFFQGFTGLMRFPPDDLTEGTKEEIYALYGDVGLTMLNCYMAVTGGNDWAFYYDYVKLCGMLYANMFVFFTFFFVFALFNILTGIFVEKSVCAAVPDRDELILEQSRKAKMEAEEFRQLCKQFDNDNTGTISLMEFMGCMESERMVAYMASVGLEVHDVELFFRIVASGEESVDINRFVEGCMSMKGNASGLDM